MDAPEIPTPAREAARRALDSFEAITMEVPVPEPMRSQLIETFVLVYDAEIERAIRKTLETLVMPAAFDNSPAEDVDPDALDVQPLAGDGAALAGQLSLNEEGGFNFNRK